MSVLLPNACYTASILAQLQGNHQLLVRKIFAPWTNYFHQICTNGRNTVQHYAEAPLQQYDVMLMSQCEILKWCKEVLHIFLTIKICDFLGLKSLVHKTILCPDTKTSCSSTEGPYTVSEVSFLSLNTQSLSVFPPQMLEDCVYI